MGGSRVRRSLFPIGSNMNGASYPFCGEYGLPPGLNHGHPTTAQQSKRVAKNGKGNSKVKVYATETESFPEHAQSYSPGTRVWSHRRSETNPHHLSPTSAERKTEEEAAKKKKKISSPPPPLSTRNVYYNREDISLTAFDLDFEEQTYGPWKRGERKERNEHIPEMLREDNATSRGTGRRGVGGLGAQRRGRRMTIERNYGEENVSSPSFMAEGHFDPLETQPSGVLPLMNHSNHHPVLHPLPHFLSSSSTAMPASGTGDGGMVMETTGLPPSNYFRLRAPPPSQQHYISFFINGRELLPQGDGWYYFPLEASGEGAVVVFPTGHSKAVHQRPPSQPVSWKDDEDVPSVRPGNHPAVLCAQNSVLRRSRSPPTGKARGGSAGKNRKSMEHYPFSSSRGEFTRDRHTEWTKSDWRPGMNVQDDMERGRSKSGNRTLSSNGEGRGEEMKTEAKEGKKKNHGPWPTTATSTREEDMVGWGRGGGRVLGRGGKREGARSVAGKSSSGVQLKKSSVYPSSFSFLSSSSSVPAERGSDGWIGRGGNGVAGAPLPPTHHTPPTTTTITATATTNTSSAWQYSASEPLPSIVSNHFTLPAGRENYLSTFSAALPLYADQISCSAAPSVDEKEVMLSHRDDVHESSSVFKKPMMLLETVESLSPVNSGNVFLPTGRPSTSAHAEENEIREMKRRDGGALVGAGGSTSNPMKVAQEEEEERRANVFSQSPPSTLSPYWASPHNQEGYQRNDKDYYYYYQQPPLGEREYQHQDLRSRGEGWTPEGLARPLPPFPMANAAFQHRTGSVFAPPLAASDGGSEGKGGEGGGSRTPILASSSCIRIPQMETFLLPPRHSPEEKSGVSGSTLACLFVVRTPGFYIVLKEENSLSAIEGMDEVVFPLHSFFKEKVRTSSPPTLSPHVSDGGGDGVSLGGAYTSQDGHKPLRWVHIALWDPSTKRRVVQQWTQIPVDVFSSVSPFPSIPASGTTAVLTTGTAMMDNNMDTTTSIVPSNILQSSSSTGAAPPSLSSAVVLPTTSPPSPSVLQTPSPVSPGVGKGKGMEIQKGETAVGGLEKQTMRGEEIREGAIVPSTTAIGVATTAPPSSPFLTYPPPSPPPCAAAAPPPPPPLRFPSANPPRSSAFSLEGYVSWLHEVSKVLCSVLERVPCPPVASPSNRWPGYSSIPTTAPAAVAPSGGQGEDCRLSATTGELVRRQLPFAPGSLPPSEEVTALQEFIWSALQQLALHASAFSSHKCSIPPSSLHLLPSDGQDFQSNMGSTTTTSNTNGGTGGYAPLLPSLPTMEGKPSLSSRSSSSPATFAKPHSTSPPTPPLPTCTSSGSPTSLIPPTLPPPGPTETFAPPPLLPTSTSSPSSSLVPPPLPPPGPTETLAPPPLCASSSAIYPPSFAEGTSVGEGICRGGVVEGWKRGTFSPPVLPTFPLSPPPSISPARLSSTTLVRESGTEQDWYGEAGKPIGRAGGRAGKWWEEPGAGFTSPPSMDLSLACTDGDMKVEIVAPDGMLVVCFVDEIGGHTGKQHFCATMPSHQAHSMKLRIVDKSYGHVWMEQRLEIPAIPSTRWGLSLHDNGLCVDPALSPDISTSVSVDRSPERAVREHFIPLDIYKPHYLSLRRYFHGLNGQCTGELSFRLPSFTNPKDLQSLLQALRSWLNNTVDGWSFERDILLLSAECSSPVLREILTTLVEICKKASQGILPELKRADRASWSGHSVTHGKRNSSSSGGKDHRNGEISLSSPRVYFRLLGGEE